MRRPGRVDDASTAYHGDHVPDLKTLIRACNDAGVTYRDMERRAKAAGHNVKFQTFAALANNAPKSFPKHTETISGMAAALGVTERAVVLAYAESLGVEVGRVGFADLVPLTADGMEPEMREAVLAVIRAATKGVTDASQEPGTGSGSTAVESEAAIGDWAEKERTGTNYRLARTKPRPVPASGSTVSDGDDTTTHGKRKGRRGA